MLGVRRGKDSQAGSCDILEVLTILQIRIDTMDFNVTFKMYFNIIHLTIKQFLPNSELGIDSLLRLLKYFALISPGSQLQPLKGQCIK